MAAEAGFDTHERVENTEGNAFRRSKKAESPPLPAFARFRRGGEGGMEAGRGWRMEDGKDRKGGPPPHVGGYAWRFFTRISGYLRVFPQGGCWRTATLLNAEWGVRSANLEIEQKLTKETERVQDPCIDSYINLIEGNARPNPVPMGGVLNTCQSVPSQETSAKRSWSPRRR